MHYLNLSIEIKVDELQKKVNGVLQIVKELIKLLHKSNIRFPSSLPVDDFKTFEDVFAKSKKELTLVSTEKSDTSMFYTIVKFKLFFGYFWTSHFANNTDKC